ncbi:MAG: GNAT family N-acetyltransferase [Planctomycetota bacterium]|nr:GNAT family N-acetyltransferase [Planctomycetota bacterium]
MHKKRNTPPSGQHRIGRAGPAKRREGIERLLGSDRLRAERFMRFARETSMDLGNLWCAFDTEGAVRCSALASINPGRTAMLFVSPPRNPMEITLASEVLQVASAALAQEGLCLVQALVTPDEHREIQAFEQSGLKQIAILTYMQASLGRRHRKQATPPEGSSFRSYRSEDRTMLEQLLARTYIETLDCPGLVGLRRMNDILDGHMNSGIFKPDWWTILSFEGSPAGACLINRARDEKVAELVYLGITPEMRGKGMGRALLAHALFKISETAQKTVVLAVDESNTPAMTMYRSAGFTPTTRRCALVRKIDRDDHDDTIRRD